MCARVEAVWCAMLEIGPRPRRRHWLPANGANTESDLCRGGTGGSQESDFEPFPRIASESVREERKQFVVTFHFFASTQTAEETKQKTLNCSRVTVSYAACALHTHTHTHTHTLSIFGGGLCAYYTWETGFILLVRVSTSKHWWATKHTILH